MEDNTPQLSARQEKAITALLTQPTAEKAAEAAGIGSTTLYRWLHDDAFKTAYQRARREAAKRAVDAIFGIAPEAVETLKALLASEKEAIRLQAAKAVLDHTFKGFEADVVIKSIEALERKHDA